MPCLGVWILPCRKQAPLASFHFFTFRASDEHLCWPFRGVSAPLVSGPLHERLSRGPTRLWTLRILRQGRHLLEADSSQLTGALLFPDPRLNSPVPLDSWAALYLEDSIYELAPGLKGPSPAGHLPETSAQARDQDLLLPLVASSLSCCSLRQHLLLFLKEDTMTRSALETFWQAWAIRAGPRCPQVPGGPDLPVSGDDSPGPGLPTSGPVGTCMFTYTCVCMRVCTCAHLWHSWALVITERGPYSAFSFITMYFWDPPQIRVNQVQSLGWVQKESILSFIGQPSEPEWLWPLATIGTVPRVYRLFKSLWKCLRPEKFICSQIGKENS